MAKRKSVSLGSKNFFMLVVLSVSALGLMLMTYASQQKTTTQSDASGCTDYPQITYEGSTDFSTGVIYHLKVKNNCANPKRYKLEAGMPTKPVKYDDWLWTFRSENDKGETNTPYVLSSFSGSQKFDIIVSRARIKNIANGKYSYISIKASVFNQPEVNDTIRLNYTVGN